MHGEIHLARDESGATAVEFALVASLLVMTVLFILGVGLTLFYGQAMDTAVARAARQIMIGAVQTASTTQADFKTNYVCANLPPMFDCSKLIVSVQTVQSLQSGGYYAFVNSNQTGIIVATTSTAKYSPGVQSSYEYVQIAYPITFLPTSIARIVGGGATYNGAPAVMLVATAAFRNEQY